MLVYNSTNCQHNNTTHMSGHKVLPHRKEYLCFQVEGGTSMSALCAKSRALNKVIGSILEI